MSDVAKCELCGEPMPEGETMFKFHGYSGRCPKPPLPPKQPTEEWRIRSALDDCYLYARRQLHHLERKGEADSERAMGWREIVRFCEKAGLRPTILRANDSEKP